ncbi:MAG: gliding motility-associated C-terminal domain-containing protein [Bacteroidales bacterium]|jgi:hypothetical protein
MKIKAAFLFVLFCFLSIISLGQTIINPGDLVILGIGASKMRCSVSTYTECDEISFACFKDITTGTQIQITDDGYERCYAGLWGSGEGGAILTRTGGTIPAGTVVTFRTVQPSAPYITFDYPDAAWSVANLGTNCSAFNFNLNNGGDQIYIAQNGTWTPGATCSNSYPGTGGRMLFAFSTSGSWVSLGNSTQKSALYPGMTCYSMAPTTATNWVKYSGPLTAAYQKDWISRINNTANWTNYSDTTSYYTNGYNLHTTILPIIPGTDADWTPHPDTMCQSSAPINLNTLISGIGQTGGTWSGTGVTGNTFTPSGLNGTYNITYTNDCPCCISQTHAITVTSVVVSAGNNAPLCSGSTLNLTSGPSGGTSYSWSGPNSFSSSSQNPSISAITTAGNGTYTVTVTDNGCSSTATTSVTIHQSPSTTSGPFTIPSGTSTTMTSIESGGTGPFTYSWAPSAYIAGSTTVQNPVTTNLTVTTVYTVTVTDAATGCTGTEQVIVNVTGSPLDVNTVTATPSSICYGSSTQIQATATGGSGTYNYAWSPATGLSNTTIYNPIASPTTTTIYTVTANDGFSNATSQVTITVYPLPVASASHNSLVCSGDTLNLTSGGGTTYSWSGPNSFLNSNQNPSITGLTSLASGTYIVTVTDSNGCSDTAQTTVTVNTSPTVSISNNTPCEGQPLNLSSSGGVNYSWNGPIGFSSNAEYPVISNADTVSTVGIYTVTVTDVNGCSSSAQTTVSVNSNPLATASSNTPCEGQTLNLISPGNPANSYNWSGPGSFSNLSQNPAVPNADTSLTQGTYTVTVTDGNGCTATAQTNVTVNSNPKATASSNVPCEGKTLTLNSNGGSTYNWIGPNSFSSSSQNPTLPNADTLSSQGIYTVTVTDINGCSATAQTTVTVNKNPIATASSNTPCEGQTLIFNSGGGSYYNWTGPNGFLSSNQNPSISGVTMSTAGSYIVTVINSHGCSCKDTIIVSIKSLPTVTATNNGPVCEGNLLDLTGGTSGMTSYTWSGPNGFSSSSQNPNVSDSAITVMSGIYTITVSDGTCTNTTSTIVTVNAMPNVALQSDPSILSSPSADIYTGEVVTITAFPANFTNYNFYIDGTSVQSGASNIYQSNTFINGNTIVVYASKGGCIASDSIILDIKPFPNAFIPKGSNVYNEKFLNGFDIQILNRWGQQLYSGTNGWDGKYKGTLVSPGTYFYIVTLTNLDKSTKTLKGSVTLVEPR